MRYSVQVKINSKVEGVELVAPASLVVKVRARPIENQANVRVIELLSEYFKVPKSKIQLIGGQKSRQKIFEVGSH